MASVSLSVFFLPKGRRQKEQRVSEDEMAGWHHRCNGHELGQTPGDGEDREAWGAAVHGVATSWA